MHTVFSRLCATIGRVRSHGGGRRRTRREDRQPPPSGLAILPSPSRRFFLARGLVPCAWAVGRATRVTVAVDFNPGRGSRLGPGAFRPPGLLPRAGVHGSTRRRRDLLLGPMSSSSIAAGARNQLRCTNPASPLARITPSNERRRRKTGAAGGPRPPMAARPDGVSCDFFPHRARRRLRAPACPERAPPARAINLRPPRPAPGAGNSLVITRKSLRLEEGRRRPRLIRDWGPCCRACAPAHGRPCPWASPAAWIRSNFEAATSTSATGSWPSARREHSRRERRRRSTEVSRSPHVASRRNRPDRLVLTVGCTRAPTGHTSNPRGPRPPLLRTFFIFRRPGPAPSGRAGHGGPRGGAPLDEHGPTCGIGSRRGLLSERRETLRPWAVGRPWSRALDGPFRRACRASLTGRRGPPPRTSR